MSCQETEREAAGGELALQGDKTPPRFTLKMNLMARHWLETNEHLPPALPTPPHDRAALWKRV